MTSIVVDASVLVAAADRCDRFWEHSRRFLMALANGNTVLAVPSIAEVEIACALARRLRDPSAGRRLSAEIFQCLGTEVHETDGALIKSSVTVGTDSFLRAGDAVYVALAVRVGGQLVSWDEELVERANAITPDVWLKGQELE